MLTYELVAANESVSNLKADLKKRVELHKKLEREKIELNKQLEGKANALEKLRKERDEIWALVNTDKFQKFKSAEDEK